MMMGGGDPGWAVLAALVMLAIALIVTYFVAEARPPDAADRILDARLARGEISPEHYETARSALARDRPPRPRRHALLLAATVTLAAIALVGATAGTAADGWPGWVRSMHDGMWGSRDGTTAQAPPPVSGAREITIVAGEFFLEPAEVSVRAGETVNFVFDNRGSAFHDLRIEGLDWILEAEPGEQDRGAFTAPRTAGSYAIICGVPGHADAGMRATLIVEA